VRTEDGALVYKCLNGEPEMFCILVDKYKASIYALVYNRLKNFHDAEDVTQEVFLQAFKNLRKLKNFDIFAIWLSSIASNLSKRWIRSNIRRIDHDFIEDKDQKVIENPSMDSYRDSKISESLHEALDSLPEIYQQVLTLHYLGGMSGMEIANTLGISHDTVRQRLSRARTLLREEMIAMMNQTFQQQKLSANFTFRIVELVKKVKINPVSDAKNLPWGLSLGAGLIFAVLMFGQHIQINLPDIAMGLPLPSDMKVLKVGEIPVDAVKVSTITSIGSKGNGKGVAPDPKGQENAFLMSPQGEGKWEARADMPTARADLAVCAVNGKIYAIGGSPDAINILSILEEYDPVSDKWVRKADMPTPRATLCASVINGKIYAIGGYLNQNTVVPTVEEYDPLTDKWTKKADMLVARGLFATCATEDKIYAIGGEDAKGIVAVAEEYDPILDKWTKKNDMLTPRTRLSASAVNGKVYAIGGAIIKGNTLEIVSTIEEFDPIADKWIKKTDMPTARAGLCSVTINGKILAIGGYKRPNVTDLSTVEEYAPVLDKWTKKPDMPTPRHEFAANVIEGKVYAIGGANAGDVNPILSTVEEFDTGIISKSVDPSGKLPKTWGMLKAK